MISLVCSDNRVLSVGVNKQAAPKPFVKRHRDNMALHSEIDSLAGLPREQTKGATLYVNGTTAAGNPMVTKPCETCLTFIEKMGIKRICYSDKGIIQEL